MEGPSDLKPVSNNSATSQHDEEGKHLIVVMVKGSNLYLSLSLSLYIFSHVFRIIILMWFEF